MRGTRDRQCILDVFKPFFTLEESLMVPERADILGRQGSQLSLQILHLRLNGFELNLQLLHSLPDLSFMTSCLPSHPAPVLEKRRHAMLCNTRDDQTVGSLFQSFSNGLCMQSRKRQLVDLLLLIE